MPYALWAFADEVAQWATVEQLEAALETAFAELLGEDIDWTCFGDDSYAVGEAPAWMVGR